MMKIYASILLLLLLASAVNAAIFFTDRFHPIPKMVSEPPSTGRGLAQMIPKPSGSQISTHNAVFLGDCSPQESFVFKVSAGTGRGAIGIIDNNDNKVSLKFLQDGATEFAFNTRIEVVGHKEDNFFALDNDDGRAVGFSFEFENIPKTGAWVELECSLSGEVVVIFKDDSPMEDIEAEVTFAPGLNQDVKETVQLKNQMTTKIPMSAIGKHARKRSKSATRSLSTIDSVYVIESNEERIVFEHTKKEKEVVLVQMEFEDVNDNLIQRTLVMETRDVPGEVFEVITHATVNDDGDVELRFDGLPSGQHYLISARLGITSSENKDENTVNNDIGLQKKNERESPSSSSIESIRRSSSSATTTSDVYSRSSSSSRTSTSSTTSTVRPSVSSTTIRDVSTTTRQKERAIKIVEVVDTKAMLDTDDAVLTIHGAWFRNKIHESNFASMMGDDWSVKVLEVQIQDPENGYEQVGVLSIHQEEVGDSRLYIRDIDHRRRLSDRPSNEEHGVVTNEMLMGRVPSLSLEKESNLRRLGLEESGTVLLVHGYCGTNKWPIDQFTDNTVFHIAESGGSGENQWSHDTFARNIALFAQDIETCGIVAHSQGGAASLHLYAYYWSCLDNASADGRILQSVGTPYLGTSLAGFISIVGEIFGIGCGRVEDLTTGGAESWLQSIPVWARKEVYYYTTSFETKWWRYDYCHMASDVILRNPDDGVIEDKRGQLEFGNNMGRKIGWCHGTSMRDDAQYLDTARNAEMNRLAAR